MCLMGNGLPQTVLLVQLSEQGKTMDRLELQNELYEQTLEINAQLDSHARIACIILSDHDWNVENGLVTHTMKIKRAALEKRYAPLAEKAFLTSASIAAPLVMREGADSNKL